MQDIINPIKWILPNKKNYISWINKTFSKYNESNKDEGTCDKKNQELKFFSYQKFIRDYMQYGSPYRGVLLYHGLGVGKTCSSIIIGEILKKYKKVIVMIPASLKQNYIDQLKFCGDSNYKLDSHWIFNSIDVKNSKLLIDLESSIHIPIKILKKNEGYWIVDENKNKNYDSLSEEQKKTLTLQIDSQIKHNYDFINYNGINNKQIDILTENDTINPFNGKLVIIDEIHNFISNVVGSGIRGKRIYKLLLNAKDLKIVCLSGTPIINLPFEIAVLFNLLRGVIEVYRFKINDIIKNPIKLEKDLNDNIYIDNYNIDYKNKIINIQLLPEHYIKKESKYVIRDEDKFLESKDIISEIKSILINNNLDIVRVTSNKTLPFPEEQDDFKSFFIQENYNKNEETMKNPLLFKRRIIGLVSYLESAGEHLYPSSNTNIVPCIMSDYQFSFYAKSREIERKKEINFKKYVNGDVKEKSVQFYKVYSRMNSNFVFPENIKRPESKYKLIKNEMDVKTDDDFEESDIDSESQSQSQIQSNNNKKEMNKSSNNLNKLYEIEIKKAMIKLENDNVSLMINNPDGLLKHSPKFNSILNNINKSPGTCLFYSQFRSVEGIGIFCLALKANGYVQFKIKKDSTGNWNVDIDSKDKKKPKYAIFTDDKDETKILMDIFNNNKNQIPKKILEYIGLKDNYHGDIIKIIMITQSGAEGISLKNVRQVHITEPYWNNNRFKQVIGRAIRTCSHHDLPLNERNVEVYRYLSVLTDKQKDNFIIKEADRGLSTDETIFNVAQNKSKLIDPFLDAMKDVAIDCTINYNYNKRKTSCFDFEKGYKEDDISYKSNIKKNILNSNLYFSQKEYKWKGVVIEFNKNKYIKKPNTNEIYDYNEYKNNNKLILIGHILNGKIRFLTKNNSNTWSNVWSENNTSSNDESIPAPVPQPTPATKSKAKVIKFKDKYYIQEIDGSKIYDYDEYKKNKKLVLIGNKQDNKIILIKK